MFNHLRIYGYERNVFSPLQPDNIECTNQNEDPYIGFFLSLPARRQTPIYYILLVREISYAVDSFTAHPFTVQHNDQLFILLDHSRSAIPKVHPNSRHPIQS